MINPEVYRIIFTENSRRVSRKELRQGFRDTPPALRKMVHQKGLSATARYMKNLGYTLQETLETLIYKRN